MSQLSSRRPRRAAFAAALVCAAAPLSFASAPEAQAAGKPVPRIYVCITQNFRTLNLSDAKTPCPRGQRKLSWTVEEGGAPTRPGRRGPSGARGPAGAEGPAGPTGPAGAPGPAGPAGPAGPRGETGPQGVGETGPAGPQGPVGPAGPQGPVGPVGPQGPEGPRGPVGPIGPAGAVGPTGDPGTYAADTGWVSDISGQTVGATAVVRLSGPQRLGANVSHPAGSEDVVVSRAGRYLIRYHVNVATASPVGAAVGVAVDNAGVPAGDTAILGGSGYVSGEVLTDLPADARVSLFNSGIGTLELASDGSGAALTVQRIG